MKLIAFKYLRANIIFCALILSTLYNCVCVCWFSANSSRCKITIWLECVRCSIIVEKETRNFLVKSSFVIIYLMEVVVVLFSALLKKLFIFCNFPFIIIMQKPDRQIFRGLSFCVYDTYIKSRLLLRRKNCIHPPDVVYNKYNIIL